MCMVISSASMGDCNHHTPKCHLHHLANQKLGQGMGTLGIAYT